MDRFTYYGKVPMMSGEWMNHPQFGKQFKVTFCKNSVPATVVGIEKYLGGGLIKGVGPVMAKRIVSVFGEKILDVIEETPKRLEDIGKHHVKMIAQD